MHHIKLCTLGDSQKVEYVLLASWLAKSKQEAYESFIDEMKKGDQYFLAEDWDQALGIVSGKTEWRPRHGLYELYHIWVVSEAKWTWLAQELFDTLVNHALELYRKQWQHLRKLYLKTGEQNTWAHRFYKKMGMRQTDHLTSHFAQWRRELIFDLFFDETWNSIPWD